MPSMRKTCLLAALACHAAYAEPPSPAPSPAPFADYPAAPQAVAKHAPIRLAGKEERRYASQLRQAARRAPDFAGHYVLVTWGCGAGCVRAAAVDIATGQVSMLPFTVSNWPLEVSEPLEYRLDSRLLVVRGSRNEVGQGAYRYEFDGRRFKLLD